MKKVLLVAALAAAVALVSAASASAARVKLSLIPLPMAALGSSAHGLALSHDSGVISNTAAANATADASPGTFNQLTGVDFNPTLPGTVQSATRVTLIATNGVLAKNVAAVKPGSRGLA